MGSRKASVWQRQRAFFLLNQKLVKISFDSFEGQNESFLFFLCFVIDVLITFHFNYTQNLAKTLL